MRGRLIGDDVGHDAAPHELRQHVRRVAFERDRSRDAITTIAIHPRQRIVQVCRALVDVPRRQPPLDAARIDLDDERDAVVHRDGERLRAAHAAEAGGDDEPSRQAAAEVPARQLGERFVGALQDALRADVDPAAGGHLAVHRQAAVFEVAERVPVGPGGHEQARSR